MAESVIRLLPEDVINRIAAGEVIHRPCNAIKEVMENSLDAGATRIDVRLREGGLKLLEIQDNGSGIHEADLPLLCQRFATSKLSTFDGLFAMTTFGFRGEALASISMVARVQVTTRTADMQHAVQASFLDGEMIGPAVPCAGTVGTTITVTDLFYNLDIRRQALRSATDEFQRTLAVIQRYAIHNTGTGFSCRRLDRPTPDLAVPATATREQAVAASFGPTLLTRLHALPPRTTPWGVVGGHVSTLDHHGARLTAVLFINDRLVDCPAIKSAIAGAYRRHLPSQKHPWAYISLAVPPADLDVNVHPTKARVNLVHEAELCEAVAAMLDSALQVGTGAARPTPAVTRSGRVKVAELDPNVVVGQRHKDRSAPALPTLDSWVKGHGLGHGTLEGKRSTAGEAPLVGATLVGLLAPSTALLQVGTQLLVASLPVLVEHAVTRSLASGMVPRYRLDPPVPAPGIIGPVQETCRGFGITITAGQLHSVPRVEGLAVDEWVVAVLLRELAKYSEFLAPAPATCTHADPPKLVEPVEPSIVARLVGYSFASRLLNPAITVDDVKTSVEADLLPMLRRVTDLPESAVVALTSMEELYRMFQR